MREVEGQGKMTHACYWVVQNKIGSARACQADSFTFTDAINFVNIPALLIPLTLVFFLQNFITCYISYHTYHTVYLLLLSQLVVSNSL